ncbi:MAG: hypothetical protein ACJA1R_002146, partial [Flavobacteriales bacterium]
CELLCFNSDDPIAGNLQKFLHSPYESRLALGFDQRDGVPSSARSLENLTLSARVAVKVLRTSRRSLSRSGDELVKDGEL